MANLTLEILSAFFLGILLSFAWLSFYLRKDPRPEPKKEILIVFLLGAFFTIPAIILEIVWLKTGLSPENSLLTIIVLAAIEEASKFSAAGLWVPKTKYFDEETDPFLYLITAAMGFAMIENIFILISEIYSVKTFSILLYALTGTSILRFLGATFLHSLSSGVLGFFWAYAIIKERKSLLLLGFILATSLHSLFNLAIIFFKESKNSSFPILSFFGNRTFLTFTSLFIISGLLVIGYLYKKLRSKNY